jgi:hypothetical protein
MYKRVRRVRKKKVSHKKNEKGLSTIVATLLIILLTLVAVGIVWVVIRNVIQSSAEQVSLGKFTLNLEIKDVHVNVSNNSISVKIKRNTGEGEISGLNFIIDDGDNTEVVKTNLSLNELEEKTVKLDLDSVNISKIKKVSVAPVFLLASGKESVGDVKDEYTVSANSGTSGTTCTVDCVGKNCGSDGCGGSCGNCVPPQTCQSGTCVDSSLLANNATCTQDSQCQSGNCDYDIFSTWDITSSSKYCHASSSKCFFFVGYGTENDISCVRCASWQNGGVWDDFISTCGANSQWTSYLDCSGSTPKCNSSANSCNMNCVQCNINSDCSAPTPSCINHVCSSQTSISYLESFDKGFLPAGWKSGGNSVWTRNTVYTINGSGAASSGVISNAQKSWINYSNTFSGAGYMWFYWNVSSEAGNDYLCFCQDKECGNPGCTCSSPSGNADVRISSTTDGIWKFGFVNQSFSIGNHFFTWCYATDSGTLSGQNMGILDNVTFKYSA